MLPVIHSSRSQPHCPSGCRSKVTKRGRFYRQDDRAFLQRYHCTCCGKSFSDATSEACYGQKKRTLNHPLYLLLTGCYSQRRSAKDLRINRKTVARKILFIGLQAKLRMPIFHLTQAKAQRFQFDDLETFEHSKYKPLSVTLAVEYRTRRILGFEVAVMPPKGIHAEKAQKRYGKRKDQRKKFRRKLFEALLPFVAKDGLIESDQNPHYEIDVREYFPKASYVQFKSRRACVTGQGELKTGNYDPLFSLNHTCAMMRANLSRLVRKSWCTTKKIQFLEAHLWMYVLRHNLDLIQK